MHLDTQKVNILILIDHLGWDGRVMHGLGRLLLQWMPSFDKEKYNVVLCTLRKKDSLSKAFDNNQIPIRSLDIGKYNPLALLSLIRLIAKEKIALIHAHGFGSSTFGRIARIITGVPILVHFHDTRPYYPLVQKIADMLLARFTDAGLAVSNSVKSFWIQTGRVPGMVPRNIIVMYNSVSLAEFRMHDPTTIMREKQRLGIPRHAKIVGTVTRLYEQKGNKYFLEAAVDILKVFPQTIFLIVGDGPLRKDLEELSRRLQIHNHVIFTGFSNDVPKLMATFDVKVFLSWHADGGSPLPVLEAMAMAKPIVATNIVEILEDGVTGLLIPPKEPKILAKKILSLLSSDSLARQLGLRARQQSKRHDVHVYVRSLERIYDRVLTQEHNTLSL